MFDAAVQWAMKAEKAPFWRSHRSTKSDSPRESLTAVRVTGVGARSKSDELSIVFVLYSITLNRKTEMKPSSLSFKR